MEFKLLILAALVLVGSGLTAFPIQLADKWGILEWYQLNRKKWMPEKCIFCLCWWMSWAAFGLLLWLIPGIRENFFFLAPFIITPLSRFILPEEI